MTLTLISIGLNSHNDLTQAGIQAARQADHLYAELYTMKLQTSTEQLAAMIGRPVHPLPRGGLEENADKLLREAKEGSVAVLVGGDALSATTHISLIIDAEKQGTKWRVVHGSSIFTAVAETGLSLYKFGKTVTVPLPEKGPVDTVLRTLRENREHGQHTLILLDLNIPEERYLTIPEAVQRLTDTGSFSPETLLVGVARLGSDSPTIRADKAENLKHHSWGDPPHALLAPGALHFLEEEALKTIAHCPPELLLNRRVQGELDRLIQKYITGCNKVLETLELTDLPAQITEEQVKELLDHVERYLSDAEFYWGDQKPVALTSVAYAEGVLDALKLLGVARFEW